MARQKILAEGHSKPKFLISWATGSRETQEGPRTKYVVPWQCPASSDLVLSIRLHFIAFPLPPKKAIKL
jgi:hypothetical protein